MKQKISIIGGILFIILLVAFPFLGILAVKTIIGWKWFWIDLGILTFFACDSDCKLIDDFRILFQKI